MLAFSFYILEGNGRYSQYGCCSSTGLLADAVFGSKVEQKSSIPIAADSVLSTAIGIWSWLAATVSHDAETQHENISKSSHPSVRSTVVAEPLAIGF